MPLPQFVDRRLRRPELQLGGWISLDTVVEAHTIRNLSAQSFEQAWQTCQDWVARCHQIMGARISNWLDKEQRQAILEDVGPPPNPCYPIYIFSLGEGSTESAVYVGRTSARHGRFAGGHAACTKLLHPRYDGYRKRVYLGCVSLVNPKGGYLPLEWVQPLHEAQRLLESIEAQLIYSLQPKFNVQAKKRSRASSAFVIQIQNFTGQTNFMNDRTSFP